MFKTFKFSVLAFAVWGHTACAETQDANTYSAPPVGTEFNWEYAFESDLTEAVVKVVATGPDFAVFLEDENTAFVEFSGLDFVGCDDDMPSAEIRAALKAAWPLKPGAVIPSHSATLTIEEASEYRLGSDNEPVMWVNYDYTENGTKDDEYAVSTRLNSVVRYKWGEGGDDRLNSVTQKEVATVEVQPGHVMLAGLNDELVLGCMGLLTETE